MNIAEHVSLADKAWFGTGGPAQYYCEPQTPQEFSLALAFAREKNIPVTVFGLGANILISDTGIRGLVIRPKLKNISHTNLEDTTYVTAGAGVSIEELITYGLNNNALGLEELSGIPGTVGGSVYINIHYFQYFIGNFVHCATVINTHTGELSDVDSSWFNFGYNSSKLQEQTHYLVQATFRLKTATDLETAFARGRSVEITRHRHMRYPYKNTCGCFFRNFLDSELSFTINNKKIVYSSYYLDKVGVKGDLSMGGACVSHQHANMIVNTGTATSKDIICVARSMQEKVREKYGVLLTPECQLLGFDQYPLLT